ncbi:MAG: PilZ domain-containing protein [Magnetococcales bacterium]|nr:PilZ domain-containing protein [Magnetococcales bacterium]
MNEQVLFRENPFFVHYGSIIVNWFSDVARKENVPLDLVVLAGPTSPWSGANASQGRENDKSAAPLDSARMKILQQKVEKIRVALLEEADTVVGKGSSRPRPMTQHLELFRLAVMQRNEGLMAENPFYELTKILFEINLAALRDGFVAHQKQISDPPPPPIKVTRSLATIWGDGAGVMTSWQKIRETLTKTGQLGKFLLGLFLYCGSSLTTAMGANDLVQDPSFVALFGDGLTGAEHQNQRMITCLLIGLLLSSVILDYKSRLFQGMAVTGRVWGGILATFRRYPRWFVMALFLTGVSISTNFDGIVLLASKSGDLQQQWFVIKERVESALGNPRSINLNNPGTLYDIRAGLESKVQAAVEKFNSVPEDEKQGLASSGVSKTGPRYWGKHYIIHGGYQPGQRDVTRESGPKSTLAQEIDAMLRTSKLDLKISLKDRMNRLMAVYQLDFRNMENLVGHEMQSLEHLLNFDSMTLENSGSMMALEPYHVNDKVQTIVKAMEKNKSQFAKTAKKIEELSAEYIQLLRAVDRAGTPSNVNYDIDIKIDIPEISAIDKLKQGEIPLAKRRSLSELYAFLLNRYGVVLGMGLLVAILFVAVSMDLSDPIFYSVMVARWGRRDREFLAENIQRFIDWETRHVARIRHHLVQPDVRLLLPALPCPKKEIIHLALHELLEATNSVVKDASTRNLVERFRYWFMELFTTARVAAVEAYNARQTLISDYYRRNEHYAPGLLNRIFPGLLMPLNGAYYTFGSYYNKLFDDILKIKEQFDVRLEEGHRKIGQSAERKVADGGTGRSMESGLAKVSSIWSHVKWGMYTIFLRPLERPDADPFPLTRVGWMQALTRNLLISRDRKNSLEQLVPFLLKSLNSRFPDIRNNYLVPLSLSLTRITKPEGLINAFKINQLKNEFESMERGYHELLGLAHFHRSLFRDNVFAQVIQANKLIEVEKTIQNSDGHCDTTPMEKQIVRLEEQFNQALRLIDSLVAQQDTLIYTLTRIRKDHLSPMNAILEHLKFREMFEMTLGIDRLVCNLKTIEDFLLDLWDSRKPSGNTNDPLSLKKRQSNIEHHEIIAIISFEKETGEFILLQQVQNLENNFQATHESLNASIFVLTLVDKIAVKIRAQLEEGMLFLEKIQEIEPLFLHGSDFQNDPVQMGKHTFLENYRLFLRSVPLQINSVKDRLDSLLRNPGIAEPHNVALCRTLESQCFKLYSFLKNCLEYLQDKRDSVGLSTALVQLDPGLASHRLNASLEPESMPEFSPEGESFPVDASPQEIVRQVEQDLETTRKLLLEINQLEWKALECPIPPQDLMKTFKTHQPFLKHLTLSLEETRATLRKAQSLIDRSDPDTDPLSVLLPVFQQSRVYLKKIRHIRGLVAASPVIDRRLHGDSEQQHASQGEKSKRSEDMLYEFCGLANPRSRRESERTLVNSTIELTLSGGEVIAGRIVDISKTGLAMESDLPEPPWARDMKGSFILGLDPGKTRISCYMVRTAGKRGAMTVDPEVKERFVQLVRDRVLGRNPGELISLNPEISIAH